VPLISVTDIKHYCYCPRIVYFEKVLHAEPRYESQQEESRRIHEELDEKEKRRKGALYYSKELLEAEKFFRVQLASNTLKIQGTIDCLIRTATDYVPIEYKNTLSDLGKPWSDHKYQLLAYALLIEEVYGTTVKTGYIDYIPEKIIVRIDFSSTMKTYTRKIIEAVHTMIAQERPPLISVSPRKCTGGCGYKWICCVGTWDRTIMNS
jgi:CRISPR-associated exonuclease Cas4